MQPNGAAALLFSRQEAHAILRPRSGRVRARCELVGRSQLWPEELTFKRKTGRSESGHSRRFGYVRVTSALPLIADLRQKDRHVRKVPTADIVRERKTCSRKIYVGVLLLSISFAKMRSGVAKPSEKRL